MLSPKPQDIDDQNWYYEEDQGIILIHRVTPNGVFLQTDSIVIPWRMIAASLLRKQAATAKDKPAKRR